MLILLAFLVLIVAVKLLIALSRIWLKLAAFVIVVLVALVILILVI